jgi:hypothetical protein
MPRVGFESTTPVFEREKTVHALDSAAAVIGIKIILPGTKTEFCEERTERSLTFIILYLVNYKFSLRLGEVRLFVGLKWDEVHGLWDELDYVL